MSRTPHAHLQQARIACTGRPTGEEGWVNTESRLLDDRRRRQLASGLFILGLVLVPFGHERQVVSQPSYTRQQLTVFLFPFDLALAGAIVMTLPNVIAELRRRRPEPAILAMALLVVATGLAALAHPTPQALQTSLRLVGLLGVAAVGGRLSPRTWVTALWALAVVGATETLVALLQVGRRSPLGLTALGEYQTKLFSVANDVAARGTFFHHYYLAGFAVLLVAALLSLMRDHGRHRWAIAAVAAIVAVPIGITYSRSLVLALAAMLLTLAVGRDLERGTKLLVAGALLVGTVVPGAIWHDGWIDRGASSSSFESGADGFTSGRIKHMHEAIVLTARHPLFGVGPGRYIQGVERELTLDPGEQLAPVHNFVLLAAAESGVLAGLAALALFTLLFVRARQGGTWGLLVFWSFFPMIMLDHFPYTAPHGLVMVGLWAGLIESRARTVTTSQPRSTSRAAAVTQMNGAIAVGDTSSQYTAK